MRDAKVLTDYQGDTLYLEEVLCNNLNSLCNYRLIIKVFSSDGVSFGVGLTNENLSEVRDYLNSMEINVEQKEA